MNRTAVAACAVGAATAVASDRAGRQLGRRPRVVTLGLALPVAAAVYPLARQGWRDRAPVVRELSGLVAYSSLGVVAALRAAGDGHRIAAAGWLTHAAFDAVHDTGRHSRIPDWYPAMCAGYDITLAALLARPM